MDATLRWKQHVDQIERKVSNTISGLTSLGNSAWGVKIDPPEKFGLKQRYITLLRQIKWDSASTLGSQARARPINATASY